MIQDIKSILKKYFGYDSFRKGQEKAINDIIEGKDVAAIMPTGSGKSLCFQIPSIVLNGLTIVISPLISLMKDQVDSLNQLGIPSAYINSTLSEQDMMITYDNIRAGEYKLVYIAPERLESIGFINMISDIQVSFVAVDEAHCISQWAHDFRPSYKKISTFINSLAKRPVVGAYTATATEVVKNDIIKLLDLNNPNVYVTGFDRENLYFSVLKGENNSKFILSYIDKHPGETGIIYAATRRETENIYNLLTQNGIKAGVYHAGLSDDEREKAQNDFAYDNIDVMVATNAFGMGIDKNNVRFVIHDSLPKNLEAYYQEAGRAGRDGQKSDCILLFNPRDIQLQNYFIDQSTAELDIKNNDYKKLRSMVDYCYTSKCLRKYILEYFGEKVEYDDCKNCSNCLDDSEKKDITIEAQKIFSCVYRVKERYGSNMIADVLKGSKNKKVIEAGLNDLSTYGIMKQYDKKSILEMTNKLAADGYLNITNDKYPLIKLAAKAVNVLKNKSKVYIKIAAVKSRNEEDNQLFVILKELRRQLALELSVPPYVIFADTALKDMCLKLPVNKDEFLNVKGVGEVKYERYGEKFINEIIKYMDENNISKDKSEHHNFKVTEDIEKIPSYKITYDMYENNKSLEDIAKEREITVRTVEDHLVRSKIEGEELDISNFVPDKYVEVIKNVLNKMHGEKLTAIKEALPEEVEYFWIKLVNCENNKIAK